MEAAFEKHRVYLSGIPRRMGLSREQAEDAVQAGLIDAWKNRHQLRDPSTIRTWLAQHVVYASYHEIRQRTRHERYEVLVDPVVMEEVEPSEADEGRGYVSELRAAIDGLPKQSKQTIEYMLLGLSYSEMSDLLGISIPSVGRAIRHAKLRLQARLAGESPLSCAEAGQLGGLSTKRRYGSIHYRKIGAMGGHRLRELAKAGRVAERSAFTG